MRLVIFAIAASLLGFSPALAGQTSLQVPQSIRLQHQQIIDRLEHFAQGKGSLGAAAQAAARFLKEHYAKEEEFVLPPLGLLPLIAKGEITKDMEPAIAMADRTKAALPELQSDHVKITSLANELIAVAKEQSDDELVRLATRIAGQSLNDIEVAHPTTILIGDYLRQRLSGRADSRIAPESTGVASTQAEQPSMPTRASRWTRARLEAAKQHWAQDQTRFKECAVKLDEYKKTNKWRLTYHRQGHFLERCMAEKH